VLLDLDRAEWSAIPEAETTQRATALAKVLEDVKSVAALDRSPEQQARFARLYLELEQPVLAAQVLDRLARADLPDAVDRAKEADAAWLAAGSPEKSAELYAMLAAKGGERGLDHARLAIERAQAAGDADASAAIIERMRALYPDNLELHELATQIAESYSAARAYTLAVELVRRAPDSVKYHRLVARLAEATGHQLRALDEYVWLVRHGGTAADRDRAIDLAKANWDLQLLRELKAARVPAADRAPKNKRTRPHGALPTRRSGLHTCQAARRGTAPAPASARLRAVREDLALDEALGDSATVLRKLTRALSGELADSQELWQRKFDLQIALGQREDALVTAQTIAQRFPSAEALDRVASLQLELGNPRGALATLESAKVPEAADDAVAYWMRLAGLAFEVGDVAAERAAYEKLIALPGAAQWQYQRLWELAPDRAAALKIALAAFDRFESEHMYYAALAIYREDKKGAEALALLERGEQYAGVRSRPDYWQTRISLQQQRTARAMQAKDYVAAKRELKAASSLIERAQKRVSFDPEVREAMIQAQNSALLTIGLASDDREMLAAGYAARSAKLSLRERVYILQKLERNEEALLLAKQGMSSTSLSEQDRNVLELDARALTQGRAQYVKLTGDALHMDGLATWTSFATVQYTGSASGLRGEASLTQFQKLDLAATDPKHPPTPVLNQGARELSGAILGRYERLGVELGVRARDEENLRPFGSARLQLTGEGDGGSFLRLHVNTNSQDNAQLRAWAARDALEVQAALPLGKRFYVSARGLAERYVTRFAREYIGAGMSVDAGAGMNIDLPSKLGAMGLRVTGRVAPRFKADDAPGAGAGAPMNINWLPQSSEWAGLGASLGKGKLDAPPLIGRDFSYIIDGAAGCLWQQQGVGVGFTAQAGVGFSVLGADLLTLAARSGNVLGSTVWGANLGYGLTLDR
ncbi:MAG TPA: tetratricopeptide repeat protein, partial [Polyangiales bacterium]|nr:tetratricopeptide repeat protein [Polyangiales bacterium]